MPDDEERFGPILATLRRTIALLRGAEVPYIVGGSLAAWARGGPEVTNDLDIMVRPPDAERVLELLVDAGMRAERPPEEWLLKAWDGDVLVDIIFCTVEGEVTDDVIARGEQSPLEIGRLNGHSPSRIQALSADVLREQVDWDAVRDRVRHTPYGLAFFTILEGLEVVPPAASARHRGNGDRVAVRPVEGPHSGAALGPASDAQH